MANILFVGESWVKHIIHQKGFDTFTSTHYEIGCKELLEFLSEENKVTHIASHEISEKFPSNLEEFDVLILSDVGSNSLLLSDSVFIEGNKEVNKCKQIRDYVYNGGHFFMIGGYMSFTGINSVARYGQTEIQEILPVKCLDIDDRVELPEGVKPTINISNHKILKNIEKEWPELFGYNKTIIKEGSEMIMSIDGNPLIVYKKFNKGSSIVFTSDCAPHWGPRKFVEWDSYGKLWNNIIKYLVEK